MDDNLLNMFHKGNKKDELQAFKTFLRLSIFVRGEERRKWGHGSQTFSYSPPISSQSAIKLCSRVFSIYVHITFFGLGNVWISVLLEVYDPGLPPGNHVALKSPAIYIVIFPNKISRTVNQISDSPKSDSVI